MQPLRHASIVIASLFLTAGIACAQNYPNKPIRIIVPTAPSGGTDLVARTPQQFADFLKAEISKWAAVIKKIGLKFESY